jgi:hypothetical protein
VEVLPELNLNVSGERGKIAIGSPKAILESIPDAFFSHAFPESFRKLVGDTDEKNPMPLQFPWAAQ